MMENFGLPLGSDHLKLLVGNEARTRRVSVTNLKKHFRDLLLIGTCLCALYQAATCHRKCHGGSHVLEALAGRTYNLSAAAYNLITLGYYDEALNLTRGIGKIYNLIALSTVDKKALREWLSSDKKTRLRKFSPSKVRKMLKEKREEFMITDEDWYSDLCEKYTHVSPFTRPNMHNESTAMVGGVYQDKGLEESLDKLSSILCATSLFVCRYFNFDDLFEEICNCLETSQRDETK